MPSDWGIICIGEDKVDTVREVKTNKNVSRRNQLTLLWKIELKNLLIKNNMPLYAMRDKTFIAEKLVAAVDSIALGKQIAEELLLRDYESVGEEIDDGQRLLGFTQSALTDSLSGENFEELTLDKWIDIYRKAKAIGQKKQAIVTNLQNARVHKIPYSDIEVSLGAPWISVEIINEFVVYLLDLDKRNFLDSVKKYIVERDIVDYEPIMGNWIIFGKNVYGSGPLGKQKWGTLKYNALQIVEATLNLREIKIFNKKNNLDEAATIAVLEKQRLIIEEFKKWIWQDESRQWEVEETYNLMFAGAESKQYDGSKLEFPDKGAQIELFDYQKNVVACI